MASAPQLLGPDGLPIAPRALMQPIAEPQIGGVRNIFSEFIAPGLTPERLANVLRQSAEGYGRDYLTLAEEMEEREQHYGGVLTTRKLAVGGITATVDPNGCEDRIVKAVQALVTAPDAYDLILGMLDGLAKGYSVTETLWGSRDGLWWPERYAWRAPRLFVHDIRTKSEIRLATDGLVEGTALERGRFPEGTSRRQRLDAFTYCPQRPREADVLEWCGRALLPPGETLDPTRSHDAGGDLGRGCDPSVIAPLAIQRTVVRTRPRRWRSRTSRPTARTSSYTACRPPSARASGPRRRLRLRALRRHDLPRPRRRAGLAAPPPILCYDGPSDRSAPVKAVRLKRLAAVAAGLLCATAAWAGDVQVYETTADAALLATRQPDLSFAAPAPADAVLTVTPSRRLQPWAGVGGAMTDSAAAVLSAMPDVERAALMRDLFAPGVGAGFSLVRVPMGASDFSAVGNYSEEPAPGAFDFLEDERVILPRLREARSLAPGLLVFAAPWSPPAWMKTSGTMDGGSVDPRRFGDLAAYFSAFVSEYRAQGVPIFAVSPQNEPLNSQSGYPTASLSATDEATFIGAFLAPRLAADGLSRVRILGLEDNWADLDYLRTLAASPAAASIAGYSFHCYKGDPSQMSTAAGDLVGGQGLWLTECSGTSGGTFASGFAYHMHRIVIGGIRGGAQGLIEWNLALDPSGGPHDGGCKTCTGIATIDNTVSPPRVSYGPVFYALAQVSRAVRPGATVVASTSSGAGMESAAFVEPDGRIVLVAFNDAAAARTFSVTDGRRSFGYALPAKSAATFAWSD